MGGTRHGAGRPVDPNSMRSQIKGLAGKEDFVTLPSEGREAPAPAWPLAVSTRDELEMWALLWQKPQALVWEIVGLDHAVALYVRTFFEAATPGAVSGLKTAALRMENDLGLSLLGMKTLGWQIGDPADSGPIVSATAARRTSSGDWLKAVSVEGA